MVIWRDSLEAGLAVGIIQRAGEPLIVAPRPLAVFQPRIHQARFIIGEINDWNPACASLQKFDVTFRCRVLIDINFLGLLSANIYFPELSPFQPNATVRGGRPSGMLLSRNS